MTMVATPQIIPLSLDQYVPLLGAAEVEELRTLAGPLEGKVVDMVNSTAVGGGVAEILTRLIPLARELGLDARWHVMEGSPEFYDITKAFHNALHGNTYTVRPRDFEIFLDYNRRNRELIPLDGRFVVIHDPQPVAFIDTRPLGHKQTWIWRCHIDLSRPDPRDRCGSSRSKSACVLADVCR
jgi:trehalose synthase